MVRDRVAELRQLLNEWDFISVFDPEVNTDEYDCMLQPLISRLSGGTDSADIQRFLDEEIIGHFGMSAGLVQTAPMAERLVRWWAARPAAGQ